MLIRVFLGWLRGERGHCGMVAVPSAEEEDAKRPSRERESLAGERTRIVNRMKGALARLGVRGFKPTLRGAPERLEALRQQNQANGVLLSRRRREVGWALRHIGRVESTGVYDARGQSGARPQARCLGVG